MVRAFSRILVCALPIPFNHENLFKIPEGILKEILMVNGIGNAQAASILKNARTIAGAFERDMHHYNFTQILDLDLLEAALVQPWLY